MKTQVTVRLFPNEFKDDYILVPVFCDIPSEAEAIVAKAFNVSEDSCEVWAADNPDIEVPEYST